MLFCIEPEEDFMKKFKKRVSLVRVVLIAAMAISLFSLVPERNYNNRPNIILGRVVGHIYCTCGIL